MTERPLQTCKTCKWWRGGECDAVNSIMPAHSPDALFSIEVSADDDSGLRASLITGPNFGCILHETEGE